MRVAELVGTLAVATDVAMGFPPDRVLRAAALVARLGEVAGASDEDRADAYYLCLLRYGGCVADSDAAASVFGDEVTVRGHLYGTDWGSPGGLLPALLSAAARGKDPLRGAAAAMRLVAGMPRMMGAAAAHCEVGDRVAERAGFGAPFRAALMQSFERWDGRGFPRRLRGEAVALPMRIVQAAEDLEFGHRTGGVEGAREMARLRAGKSVEPRLAERFRAQAAHVCAVLEGPSPWKAALDAEPGAPRTTDDDGADEVLAAIGDLADLKSRFTRTHARGVAALVREAARHVRLDAATARTLERAALVHDVGCVSVSAAVWDKAGPLSDDEWERVRAHTYVGERILSRSQALAPVAEVATLAHERLDGGGYHRRLRGDACTAPARLLAAADVFHAMTEGRPHRAAMNADEAAGALSRMGKAGSLCPDAVAAVLAAVGRASPPRREKPAGLTDREIDVLRLVARGLTNKEVATHLDISVKTAGNHLQSVFQKLGVTTRAGATMIAMQRGIVAA